MESTTTVTRPAPQYHTIVHFEIPAKDPSTVARFYEQLFGWKFNKMETGGNMDYWLISHKDAKSPNETMGGLYKPDANMSQQGILNYIGAKAGNTEHWLLRDTSGPQWQRIRPVPIIKWHVAPISLEHPSSFFLL